MSRRKYSQSGGKAITWMSGFTAHDRCFVCGASNADGLRLIFEKTEMKILCRTNLDSRFQGYDGIVHGGTLASIADATMVNLVYQECGGQPRTCRLEMCYRVPVHIGDEIMVEASILRSKRHIVWVSCLIAVGNRLCTEANAVFKIEQEIKP